MCVGTYKVYVRGGFVNGKKFHYEFQKNIQVFDILPTTPLVVYGVVFALHQPYTFLNESY